MSPNAEFYIFYEDKGNQSLESIIPQRTYQSNYRDVAFYVFVKENRMDEVKEKLNEILKKQLYK